MIHPNARAHAQELAAIVNANEEVKSPPGMAPFTPLPEEPVSL